MEPMTNLPSEYLPETDMVFEPVYDFDLLDDTGHEDIQEHESAWQKIERRKEFAWLRDQMIDWDDWEFDD